MTPLPHSLFDGIQPDFQKEFFETLVASGTTRIERIVSAGHATPPGEWYDQGWDEWVLLVSGEATLLFADNAAPLTLKPGDHLLIPSGCRHRVEHTDSGQKTIWLAVHFGGDG